MARLEILAVIALLSGLALMVETFRPEPMGSQDGSTQPRPSPGNGAGSTPACRWS